MIKKNLYDEYIRMLKGFNIDFYLHSISSAQRNCDFRNAAERERELMSDERKQEWNISLQI